MRAATFSNNPLKILLKRDKVATMDDLKSALDTHAPITVYRKLSELGYLTSYTHGSRYYTLESIPHFNEQGLWSYQSIGFSIHGTLLKTLVYFIDSADDGFFSEELESLLQVNVKPSLLKLFKQGNVTRKKHLGRYLYCAAESSRKKQQIASRQANNASQGTRGIVMGSDWVSDEIKAAIIIFVSLLDEKQRRLFAGLESLQFGHGGDSWIAKLLNLDPHTVSKGRRQLLERDIHLPGMRASGAGRPKVKKNT
ncbi:MAG: hypothetical protein HOE12_11895 [Gammaproteobacteria bacterium]|jgi:predicted transcriptional regulator|nr:hypothetical protein [Gammaproteobacteria bacterium]